MLYKISFFNNWLQNETETRADILVPLKNLTTSTAFKQTTNYISHNSQFHSCDTTLQILIHLFTNQTMPMAHTPLLSKQYDPQIKERKAPSISFMVG
uniref:Uncharacterized protein n=1 Tax=Manihot esculenta TaxID=3983 RepID=A0A2C9UMA0_MANES